MGLVPKMIRERGYEQIQFSNAAISYKQTRCVCVGVCVCFWGCWVGGCCCGVRCGGCGWRWVCVGCGGRGVVGGVWGVVCAGWWAGVLVCWGGGGGVLVCWCASVVPGAVRGGRWGVWWVRCSVWEVGSAGVVVWGSVGVVVLVCGE